VIDGKSKLTSALEISLLNDAANHAWAFSSATDFGIYDAMNKGTTLCKGDYVQYLNSGDVLHPAFTLAKLLPDLISASPAMIWGTCHERFPNGQIVPVKNRSPKLAWYGMPVNHQNVMFRRDLLGNTPYDLQYQICADYDLVSRLLNQG